MRAPTGAINRHIMTGKIYIVGAGCGSPEYLTMRAYTLLQQAEVLIYDALVNAEIVAIAPPTCTQIFVGKRGGQPSAKQADIDRLLVEHCQQGKQVVRLKTGDPLIFGRTTSEIQAKKGVERSTRRACAGVRGDQPSLVRPLRPPRVARAWGLCWSREG